jgi:hypothetical protein
MGHLFLFRVTTHPLVPITFAFGRALGVKTLQLRSLLLRQMVKTAEIVAIREPAPRILGVDTAFTL